MAYETCANCRRTEKNLAAAYARLTALITAERDLSLAESYAREAQTTAIERRTALRDLRMEQAAWLEEQR